MIADPCYTDSADPVEVVGLQALQIPKNQQKRQRRREKKEQQRQQPKLQIPDAATAAAHDDLQVRLRRVPNAMMFVDAVYQLESKGLRDLAEHLALGLESGLDPSEVASQLPLSIQRLRHQQRRARR